MTFSARKFSDGPLNNLLDAELKALLEDDADAVLAEASEVHADPKGVANKLRAVIEDAIARAGRRRLLDAREALDREAGTRSNVLAWPADRKRALVTDLRRENATLTMAARQQRQESEADLDSLIEDFIDLGLIDDMGDRI